MANSTILTIVLRDLFIHCTGKDKSQQSIQKCHNLLHINSQQMIVYQHSVLHCNHPQFGVVGPCIHSHRCYRKSFLYNSPQNRLCLDSCRFYRCNVSDIYINPVQYHPLMCAPHILHNLNIALKSRRTMQFIHIVTIYSCMIHNLQLSEEQNR